jgi:hypothetical protein
VTRSAATIRRGSRQASLLAGRGPARPPDIARRSMTRSCQGRRDAQIRRPQSFALASHWISHETFVYCQYRRPKSKIFSAIGRRTKLADSVSRARLGPQMRRWGRDGEWVGTKVATGTSADVTPFCLIAHYLGDSQCRIDRTRVKSGAPFAMVLWMEDHGTNGQPNRAIA